MKDAKELYYSNVKDLTEEEITKLADYELNICDKCGSVDSTYDLIWADYLEEDELETLTAEILEYTAVCLECFNGFKK